MQNEDDAHDTDAGATVGSTKSGADHCPAAVAVLPSAIDIASKPSIEAAQL
jgi:hypothetical protein